ncbi:MAG: response regulator [Candidatus Latescibacteria bacterium]|nr:response regulator [Candidatus Latescibacterota bacterium]MCK5329374.1 response regulator [Candidatus Latescibacterota bacterium]MCK5525623.1 response regulator [Candidatus Latescibacterota bacterium]
MGTKGKVLIVEDEATWRKLYRKVLEKEGYRVWDAGSLSAALDLLDRHFFHAAIVDIRLVDNQPGNQDGIEAVKRIAQADEGTRVIVITAFGTIQMTRDAFKQYNVFEFMEKQTHDQAGFRQVVEQAVKEAESKAMERRGRGSGLRDLIKGFSPQEIQEALASGGLAELEPLFKGLLYSFLPLLPDREEARLIEREAKPVMVEVCYWSRMSGLPILVRFGRRPEIEAEVRAYDEHPEESRVRLNVRIGPHFGGIVYQAPELAWERFIPGFPETH